MKKLAFALLVVLVLIVGCKNRLIFLPIPYSLVVTRTIQDDVGTFYEDTLVLAVDFGADANDAVDIGEEDTLVGIYLESVTYTILENRVPGSMASCYLRFRRNSGPAVTLVNAEDVDLDDAVGDTISLVPNPMGVDTLRDFLSDAMEGNSDTLSVWLEGTSIPDTMDFDVEFTITFTLLKSMELNILSL
jgi:hypothetical protein